MPLGVESELYMVNFNGFFLSFSVLEEMVIFSGRPCCNFTKSRLCREACIQVIKVWSFWLEHLSLRRGSLPGFSRGDNFVLRLTSFRRKVKMNGRVACPECSHSMKVKKLMLEFSRTS